MYSTITSDRFFQVVRSQIFFLTICIGSIRLAVSYFQVSFFLNTKTYETPTYINLSIDEIRLRPCKEDGLISIADYLSTQKKCKQLSEVCLLLFATVAYMRGFQQSFLVSHLYSSIQKL